VNITPLVGKIQSLSEILMLDFPFFMETEGCECLPAKKLSSLTFLYPPFHN